MKEDRSRAYTCREWRRRHRWRPEHPSSPFLTDAFHAPFLTRFLHENACLNPEKIINEKEILNEKSKENYEIGSSLGPYYCEIFKRAFDTPSISANQDLEELKIFY